MQDRFKFRVWNKKVKKMYDVKSMSYIDGVIKRIEVQSDIGIAIFDEYGKHIDNCILMQCTGLKDKNGKLIYEGDILKLAEFGKPVEVKHRALGFVLRRGASNTVGYDNDKYIPEDCEVIGNIYENHDLLEVKNDNK